MAYRHFIDQSGKTWQVWEVRPARVERRMRERRRAQLPFTGPERRGTATERRQRSEQRIFLGEELAHGWLAFHTGSEKRRYAPIPERWEEMSQKELSRLCEEATPVQAGGPSFGPRNGGGGGGGGGGGMRRGPSGETHDRSADARSASAGDQSSDSVTARYRHPRSA